MQRIGFAVPDLGPSQLAFNLINNANIAVGTNHLTDVIAFYEHHRQPCIAMCFGAMQIMEAWGYEAPIVATSFNTAAKALRFPTASKKFFYVWDLEWLRGGPNSFEELCLVYRNMGLELVARSVEHKLAIESAWNRPVAAVIEDCDVEAFLRLANE